MSEPVTVSAPNNTSNPSAVMRSRPRPSPPYSMYLKQPTSTAARAPNECESAIRCGIAVIGMKMAISAPMVEPTAPPIRMYVQVSTWVYSSVPTTARAMPISARNMPRRAVAGELSARRPSTNRTAAAR